MLLAPVLWVICSIVRVIHFKADPEHYLPMSAPWYTGILLNAVVGGVIFVILAAAVLVLRKKIRAAERAERRKRMRNAKCGMQNKKRHRKH